MTDSSSIDLSFSINLASNSREDDSKDQSVISSRSSSQVKDESPRQALSSDSLTEESVNEDQETVAQPSVLTADSTSKQNISTTDVYKRTKTTIPHDKRAALHVLYQKHGVQQPVEWYSEQTKIRKSAVSKFMDLMKHGIDVRKLSYRSPNKPRINKTSKFPPIVSMKEIKPEIFSLAPPIQLSTMQTGLDSSLFRGDLNNLVLQKKDEIISKHIVDAGQKVEGKRKQKVNDAKMRDIEFKKNAQQQQHGLTLKEPILEITPHITVYNSTETEQLRKNRESNPEILSSRVAFSHIDLSLLSITRAVSQLSSQEAKRIQLSFIEKYRRALVEGQTVFFASINRYDMHVSYSRNPEGSISLSLLSLFSSGCDIFCELFLGIVTDELIKEWITCVLESQFSNKAPLIVATDEILNTLPESLPSIRHSSATEVLSPVKYMIDIWEKRIKFYSVLSENQTVKELLDQFSMELQTLPRTSLLKKLAEIRECVWWDICSSTWVNAI